LQQWSDNEPKEAAKNNQECCSWWLEGTNVLPASHICTFSSFFCVGSKLVLDKFGMFLITSALAARMACELLYAKPPHVISDTPSIHME